MDISNKNNININGGKITVIGLGKSGEAAALLGAHLGANIFMSDGGSTPDILDRQKRLISQGITVEIGGHTDKIYDADLWVLSPGIPQDAAMVLTAKEKGIPVVSEIEFGSWFTQAPILALTGSNGKTTSVHLLAEMCDTENISPALSGNVGTAFSEVILKDLKNSPINRIHVLEISSFQMEHIVHFKPFISIFLNITPDHLDRYPGMDDYIQAKMCTQ